ncbi:hypothetical protein ACW2QC_17580 [Virgibacillus sp. FSP13]
MFLFSVVGDVVVGDIIFQIFLLLFVAAIVAGVILLFAKFKKRNKRLLRIEEKLDRVLSEKER